MDLAGFEYATWDDLMTYVYGSAAVIGLEMLPVLGHPGVPRAEAEPYAKDLGIAFQVTNIVRDVGEDLQRGRIYLPKEYLKTFEVDREHLERGAVDDRIRSLLVFQIARCREIFRAARPGIGLLHPASRDCVRTAFRLYGGILDEVERAGYQVLDRRITVPLRRRLTVVTPALARALLARTASSGAENRAAA